MAHGQLSTNETKKNARRKCQGAYPIAASKTPTIYVNS